MLADVAAALPLLAAGARRLHDTNKSGWWQLLGLAPFGVIVVFIVLAQESMPSDVQPVNQLAGVP